MLLQVQFADPNWRISAPEASLAELGELCGALELEVCDTVQASRAAPHPRTFVGSGKVEEVGRVIRASSGELLIVNHELSPGQQRNLEQALDIRVITRTELILHIFAARAQTHEGQLQVELAQLQHAQTRLVRGWTHLDRQKGGIGLRGAGETQIELDQRMLGNRIKATQRKLAEVAKRRDLSRRRRSRNQVPVISLVGYTNAGKSTLFNRLTEGNVLVADQIFATLDPTLRRVDVPGLGTCVLGDTVGFIGDLPHALVDAFKSTLEEVAQADLLLHVVDAADPRRAEKIEEVSRVLNEIGAGSVPQVLVWNKIDQLDDHTQAPTDGVAVSALTGVGMPALIRAIGDARGVARPAVKVRLGPADGGTRAWLYEAGAVMAEETHEDGSQELTLRADDALVGQLRRKNVALLAP